MGSTIRGDRVPKSAVTAYETRKNGMKLLLKILVFIVSYGIAFASAFYAYNHFDGEFTPTSVWVILVIFAIFGYCATKPSSSSYYTGGENGQAFAYNMIMLAIRILFSIIAGIFVAPWKIASKLTTLH